MTDRLKITPSEFILEPDDAIKKSLVLFVLCIVFAAFFLWRFASGSDHAFGYLIAILCFAYPIGTCLFTRLPTSVEIDQVSNVIHVDYLNGFGTSKTDSIELNDAYIRYVPRYRLSQNDMQVRITQSVINNWIYIDKTHGFSQDQVRFIYETISSRLR